MMFGEVKKQPELMKKFEVEKTPALLVVTDPFNHKGEPYDMTDIKIDQLEKFLRGHAYSSAKTEKVKLFQKLTYALAMNPNTGVCGQKTSDLCMIIFLHGKGQVLLDQLSPLVEQFKTDPISISYVHPHEELYMAK